MREEYRVVGVESRTRSARKPIGQIVRIQQNGGVTAATTVNRRGLATASPVSDYQRGDIPWHESS
jgi:hypothetical protein